MAAGMVRHCAALLVCLFIASGVVAEIVGVYDVDDIRFLDMGRNSFNITCKVNQTSPNFIINWYKEGMAVSNSTVKDRYKLTNSATQSVLTIKPVQEDDFGNYTCRLDGQTDMLAAFRVYGKPYVRLPPNHNVVEGQKIKIVCTVIGKPYPTISWLYNNGTGANETLEAKARIEFNSNEAGVENAVLVLSDAVASDYGHYYCMATSIVGDLKHVAVTTLRVKDKYAALWPFIGICAEVVVLCAIILVYEKRRSKSADMDDSDTDNHDQKEPIEQNKESSNLHQRK